MNGEGVQGLVPVSDSIARTLPTSAALSHAKIYITMYADIVVVTVIKGLLIYLKVRKRTTGSCPRCLQMVKMGPGEPGVSLGLPPLVVGTQTLEPAYVVFTRELDLKWSSQAWKGHPYGVQVSQAKTLPAMPQCRLHRTKLAPYVASIYK